MQKDQLSDFKTSAHYLRKLVDLIKVGRTQWIQEERSFQTSPRKIPWATRKQGFWEKSSSNGRKISWEYLGNRKCIEFQLYRGNLMPPKLECYEMTMERQWWYPHWIEKRLKSQRRQKLWLCSFGNPSIQETLLEVTHKLQLFGLLESSRSHGDKLSSIKKHLTTFNEPKGDIKVQNMHLYARTTSSSLIEGNTHNADISATGIWKAKGNVDLGFEPWKKKF